MLDELMLQTVAVLTLWTIAHGIHGRSNAVALHTYAVGSWLGFLGFFPSCKAVVVSHPTGNLPDLLDSSDAALGRGLDTVASPPCILNAEHQRYH